jgi:hypothetical protein
MPEIAFQLKKAAITLSIPRGGLVQCSLEEAKQIVSKAKAVFVEGNPSAWWVALKRPYVVHEFPEGGGYKHISEIIPSDRIRCWLIPETGEDSLPVFDVAVHYITALLDECETFEYYCVDKDYRFLLVENDHNQLIFAS